MSIINSVLGLFLGNKYERDIKEINPYITKIHSEFEKLQELSNDALRDLTENLKKEIQSSIEGDENEIKSLREKAEAEEDIYQKEELYNSVDKIEKQINEKLEVILDQLVPKAFAIVKETARRFKQNKVLQVTARQYDRDLAAARESITIDGNKALWKNTWIAGGNEISWDMVHYDVQLIGGVALHKGKIAEMGTGEGKTVVATLPVFLNALAGRGVHIVTVNDYLSKRDSEWMGPIYEFHGLSVDCIDKHQPNSPERRKAYNADITFGTNNEFGFDYLRDNMAINPEDLVQRKHHYAIVDEVDSVLIDDARTPLIISGPTSKSDTAQFDELKPKVDKLVSAQKKLVTQILADARKLIGDNKNEEGGLLLLRAYKGLPKNHALIKFLSEEGNKSLLLKTENFYMQNNSKDMHKATDELFFIIDEKANSIELTEKGLDLISTSVEDSSFFILPDVGSKIADIEKSGLDEREKLKVKDELLQDFSVKSERVHTMTQLLKAWTLFDKDTEYVVIDNKVKIVDEQTGRILEGRRYSDGLHQAIEAKENVKVEAATQTYATITLQNYFRMYHKLSGMTGTAETEAGELWNIYKLDVVVIPTNVPVIRFDREDLVYKTKREKYNAVIDEIAEMYKLGRPVLVGTTSVEISELLSRMLKMKGLKHNVLNAKLHQREAEIVAEAGKPGTITIATNMAGRGTDIKLTEEVKRAGGLAIIGTERHESRRVDRQLRGRAGRQGDPGSSQFFVSLEDELMRLFGSERIAGIMDKLGLKDGEMIQHSMITRSIERAQKKVEENNFGIRKRLLEYDDVMNSQREVIYRKRRHALLGERLSVDIANMMFDVTENLVEIYHSEGDSEGFDFDLIRSFSMDSPVKDSEFKKLSPAEVTDNVYAKVLDAYKRKVESISAQAYPVLKDVYERMSHQYENVVVPISDGVRVFQVITNLKATAESEGRELARSYEKTVVLATIDDAWKEHLREMDDLKQSVQNATYEQKDPLLIYKFESFDLFKIMLAKVNKDVVSTLMKGHIPTQDPDQVREAQRKRQMDMSNLRTSKSDFSQYSSTGGGGPERNQRNTEPVRVEKKVGRNDPCPCGSGKKYKQCHGLQQQPGAPA
ncbi:MAG: preprotein translocase subunit SecA [Bacteroidetes bacterium GWE2_41_25]|nr:MAG: preprotein translocase subunit SecA [Bacteroidetes bacterium GWA2_40_15]OFX92201.1 MAG: preprotein translocase subunit SecA [Bacteroidetes bacterium GWC2_40_22]OFY02010.1 MAG: preprotein translocase subunit SecA [Bacteroidetes bacterium GWE2_41_25]HBH82965.1 preprotein translocase subunit SecA [Bacteroidales bacterium]HBQ83401.1 preprotein translocase subunit SecA [Bacteroidales bacterium]